MWQKWETGNWANGDVDKCEVCLSFRILHELV